MMKTYENEPSVAGRLSLDKLTEILGEVIKRVG